MRLDFTSEQPIYLQLAEGIEDDILKGIIKEDEQVPSTTEISVLLKINPATARKGINVLVASGVLYKKRGIGMFVSLGAQGKIHEKRKASFYEMYIVPLLGEARKLAISKDELKEMIEGGGEDIEN